MNGSKEKKDWKLSVICYDGIRKIESVEYIHMKNVGEKVSFYASAIVYLLFNLRLASGLQESMVATLKQIAVTLPYVAGITWVLISFLQYMASGEKMPWERRLRLFFAIGIMAGLFYAIYEYSEAGAVLS